MATHVAVVNTPGLVVAGLADSLMQSGYTVEPTDDSRSWAAAHRDEAMLVGIRRTEDIDLVGELCAQTPSMALVALLDPMSGERTRSCLAVGASSCVSIDWSADRVVLALEAAMRGLALLPVNVARDMAFREIRRSIPRELSNSQQSWLRRLAGGMTITELASQVGFSERETYRRLRQIYSAMGVRGRTEALMLASASGLIDGASAGANR